ncbi:hypothetical protein D0469_17225 [Peribacillus saganii]|uniref:Alanyl-transfer RNA synthetases family profile domain-containing protein n=1 Tax=Peribacillus saganii TaxID=2303992 RepID=A0A372LJ07_9BACI|nr:DHHA1 domain-containing protein [Peribacillus saganii]RFU66375.1 hypothetical protein D0469_17225 [Peribacillus saganii]
MQERLYYSQPDVFAWETKIVSYGKKGDLYDVILEETAFYPEGGGHPSDTGAIAGLTVKDVFKQDDVVHHILPSLPSAEKVSCQIDSRRRIDHTQQHTGQHLLSAVCIELFNAPTVSFHLGIETVTIDIEIPDLTFDMVKQIEQRTNEYIYQNRKINTYYVTEAELESLPIRKMPKVRENIRIVEIDGIDVSACAGTHVKQTAEIGTLKILKTEKQKNNTRVYFICGFRAIADYQETHDTVMALSAKFSTNRNGLADRIEKLQQDQKKLEKENAILKEQLLAYRAEKMLSSTENGFLIQSFDDIPFKEVQLLSTQIIKKADIVVLLVAESENKVMLAHNGFSEVHPGLIFKENVTEFNGRGGGSNKTAQAGFPSKEDCSRFVQLISSMLG